MTVLFACSNCIISKCINRFADDRNMLRVLFVEKYTQRLRGVLLLISVFESHSRTSKATSAVCATAVAQFINQTLIDQTHDLATALDFSINYRTVSSHNIGGK